MKFLRPERSNVKPHIPQTCRRRFCRDELVISSYRLGIRHAALRIAEHLGNERIKPDLAKLLAEMEAGRG